MGPAAFSNCNHYPARVLRISVLSTTRMATVVDESRCPAAQASLASLRSAVSWTLMLDGPSSRSSRGAR